MLLRITLDRSLVISSLENTWLWRAPDWASVLEYFCLMLLWSLCLPVCSGQLWIAFPWDPEVHPAYPSGLRFVWCSLLSSVSTCFPGNEVKLATSIHLLAMPFSARSWTGLMLVSTNFMYEFTVIAPDLQAVWRIIMSLAGCYWVVIQHWQHSIWEQVKKKKKKESSKMATVHSSCGQTKQPWLPKVL